jgi:hypothetical protein
MMPSQTLRRIQTLETEYLRGFLQAAGPAFRTGNLELWLDAACFEILAQQVSVEDVISAAYPEADSDIESTEECTLESMMAHINSILTVSRQHSNPEFPGIPLRLERRLREGYWTHIRACLDYTQARITKVGGDVPAISIGDGFTYVLYANDDRRCLILVGNVSE